MKDKIKNKIKKIIRFLTKWAWKEELDRRYTHLEVAAWLSYYHNGYRELTLSQWVAFRRDGELRRRKQQK